MAIVQIILSSDDTQLHPAQFVSVQAFEPMARCAAQVMEANGFEDKIQLIHARSTDITIGTGEKAMHVIETGPQVR